MLLSFTCQNYRSFRSEAILDLQQRSFKTNRPNDDDWSRVTQRIAAIYGPNASGKSNLLRPLEVLEHAVQHSIRDDSILRSLRDPHRLAADETTVFTVDYVVANIRFFWEVELGNDGVVSEKLQANETGHWRNVFTRENSDIRFGNKSGITKRAQENIAEYATPWALTLTAWSVVKTPGHYYPAVQWWTRAIDYMSPHSSHPAYRHEGILSLASKHQSWLALGTAALALADVGVSKITINETEAPAQIQRLVSALNKAFNNAVNDEFAQELEGTDITLSATELDYIRQHLEFTHSSTEGDFTLDEADESLGTMMFFDLLVPAVYRLVTGGVFIVDEIDSSLHPILLRELVHLFKDPATNPTSAQLIFSTHDVTLLGNDLDPVVTPSEAWLVEKHNSFSTLIAWDEYTIRKNHNVEKRYMQGAFGALPITDRTRIQDAIAALRQEFLAFQER